MENTKKIYSLIIAALGALLLAAIVLIVAISAPEPETTYTDEAWSYEVCRHGMTMYFMGLGYEGSQAVSMAHDGCDASLDEMGFEKFYDTYRPHPDR